MNGRVYDPILARFLSPDPYVQLPGYANNFNRYSYVLNNPLVHTDPNGEFFLGTLITFGKEFTKSLVKSLYAWGVGFVDRDKAAKILDKAWRTDGPFSTGSKTHNSLKIDIGGFISDENKKPLGRTWEVISRWTWQIPQTLLGKTFAHGANNLGLVNEINYFGGATVVNTTIGNGGMTLGSYIYGKNMKPDFRDHTFVHEYGHYLQGQKWGLFYIPLIAIPSIESAILDNNGGFIDIGEHRNRWFEAGASRYGGRYFDKYYGSGLDSYVKGSPDYFDLNSFINVGWKNTSPYLNPRKGTTDPQNYWGHPFKGKFHWSDPLLYIYILSFLPIF